MNNLAKLVNTYSILKQIPIFSKLKWFELHAITNVCAFVEYKKGEIISRQGTPPDAFYCVISGRLQAYITKPNDEKQNVEFIHRGMYFGIISLLTGESHIFTFEALNDSVILKITKDDFLKILDRVPRLGLELSQSFSRRIRNRDSQGRGIFESQIISVYGPIKASGASTYALNLAFHLERETHKKVLLVSISSTQYHPMAHSATDDASPKWRKEPVSLKSIVGNHQKIVDCIFSADSDIDLLHVSFDPQEGGLVGEISSFVSSLATDYHFVVVDLPNEMDDIVFKTLTQSDLVQLIVKNRSEDLKLTAHVIERLKRALNDQFSAEKVSVMISGVDKDTDFSYDVVNAALNHQAQRLLPHIAFEELKIKIASQAIVAVIPALESEYAQVIRRVARQIGGVSVGLVLGGGAALGIAHIGVLKILEREGIAVDIVVGSSIGSLIGSLWVSGKSADEIEIIAREFEQKKAALKLIDPLPSKSGLSGHNITRWLRKHLGEKTFYSTRIPFKAIAYDLLKREELILDEGSLVDAVRQSISIPGVISPIVTKERLIIDGGVCNPLPTNIMAALGIKKIIAVNVLQSPEDVIRGYEIEEAKMREEEKIPFKHSPSKYIGLRLFRLARKLFYPNIPDIIVRSLQAVEYVIAEQSTQQADVVIHPDLTGINWFELYEVDAIIKRGEEAAERSLEEIKRLVSE